MTMEAGVGVMQRRVHEPRNAGASKGWEVKGTDSPLEIPVGMQLCQHRESSL